MDRSKFIKLAPYYYALAVAVLARDKSTFSTDDAMQRYQFTDDDGDEDTALRTSLLLAKATLWLAEKNMIEVISDDFGPMLFKRGDDLITAWDSLEKDKNLPFYKWELSGRKLGWLMQALRNVNEQFDTLKITSEDFERPDQDWMPLPLDRANDGRLATAIEAIDQTIEQVRADNGYSATEPDERNYVLDSLSNVGRTLKQSTSTSFMYIRTFALEPLTILIKRYKGAALEIVASAAKGALIEWLKQMGLSALDLIPWL